MRRSVIQSLGGVRGGLGSWVGLALCICACTPVEDDVADAAVPTGPVGGMQSMNEADAASALDGAPSPDMASPTPVDAQPPPPMDGAPTPDATLSRDSALTEDAASDVSPPAPPVDATAVDAAEDMAIAAPDAAPDAGGRADPDAAPDMGVVVAPDATPDMAGLAALDAAPDMAEPVAPDAAPDMAVVDGPPDMATPAPDAAGGGYPEGPYGTAVGDIIEDLEFISHEGGPLYLSDLRALEGARLINLSTVAGWCGVCVRKMPPFEEVQRRLRPSGFIGVISIYQERGGDPADAEDAARWRRSNGLSGEVVADPVPVMAPYFPRFGREKYLLIDAVTMEIVHISETFAPAELSGRAEAWLEE